MVEGAGGAAAVVRAFDWDTAVVDTGETFGTFLGLATRKGRRRTAR
jgi:hypothetical protein